VVFSENDAEAASSRAARAPARSATFTDAPDERAEERASTKATTTQPTAASAPTSLAAGGAISGPARRIARATTSIRRELVYPSTRSPGLKYGPRPSASDWL